MGTLTALLFTGVRVPHQTTASDGRKKEYWIGLRRMPIPLLLLLLGIGTMPDEGAVLECQHGVSARIPVDDYFRLCPFPQE